MAGEPASTDVENRMRGVLIDLTMTSNGTVTRMDSDSGGGSARHYEHVVLVGSLDPHDAPQLRYLRLYDHAGTDIEREAVIVLAVDELDRIQHTRADRNIVETLDELYDRIVIVGEGWPRREVANNVRSSVLIVARARRERGRDEEWGRPVEDSTGLHRDARRVRVLGLKTLGRSAHEIERALGIPYSTVLRDLGGKK